MKSGKRSTLFSYFKPIQAVDKTPPATKKPRKNPDQENEEPMEATPTPTKVKQEQQLWLEDDDSEGDIGKPKNLSGRVKRQASMSVEERVRRRKKRRKFFESDNEEDSESGEESRPHDSSSSLEESVSVLATPPIEKNSKRAFRSKVSKTPTGQLATPTSLKSTPSRVNSPSTPSLDVGVATGLEKIGTFRHDTLEFLKDGRRRDKTGKKVGDPDYNPRTLLVPQQHLNKCTPAMRQWWEIKSENFDTILFFKVGKFYELYHMDAVIGVKELQLVFMKGDFAHAGFPEKAFGKYSQTLIQKGHRIARVEQTETPQMMEERVQKMSCNPTRFDKVIRREICSLVTKGTRTLGFYEGEEPESSSAYLLAIKENTDSCSKSETEFGVCFLDTCIGIFHLGQFTDDRHHSRLRTLLAHYPLVQIIMERGNLSHKSLQLVNQLLTAAIKDTLSATEFWNVKKTLKYLVSEGYCLEQDESTLPGDLRKMIAKEDGLGLSPVKGYELALCALGACIWTLKRSLIDNDILQMKQFQEFVPVDELNTSSADLSADMSHDTSIIQFKNRKMVLDGITIANLEIFNNSGQSEGTLLECIDHTCTSFGRRLLKEWVSAPLCNVSAINERLDAVTELMEKPALVLEVKNILKSLPDLERLLRRVHVLGSKVRSQSHPESRAILYENLSYNKKKISDFLSLLEGLEKSKCIVDMFSSHTISSNLLSHLVTLSLNEEKGKFPQLDDKLDYFKSAFDHERARKGGTIIPHHGVNTEYDESLREIKQVEQDLAEYLQQQRKRLNCKRIDYWGSGRNRYQLEVPDTISVPNDYQIKSQRKGFFRYWSHDTETLLARMMAAEEKRDVALRDTMRSIFHSFGEDFSLWESAISRISILDVLVSIATYSARGDGVMCRPDVVSGDAPFLEIREGRHPCVIQTYLGGDFIPNDIVINSNEVTANGQMCTLVTGPNMGGKSTLMRQTGLIVILAQMGCYVPAISCRLSPIDRIFTRLGASDRIMHCESTFFVELSETSVILHHSTPNSLVLLDELGRGTATYDGTAIATAVVKYLAEERQCRTLFSTHYHSLVDEFKDNPFVQLGHMSCMVQDDKETITFLYKFVEGACPKSYGFNAAKLAGIPQQVIDVAKQTSRDFERTSRKGQLFRKLFARDLATPTLLRTYYRPLLQELLTDELN